MRLHHVKAALYAAIGSIESFLNTTMHGHLTAQGFDAEAIREHVRKPTKRRVLRHQEIRGKGMEPGYPLLIEEDARLVDGYGVVHYPGTRREIWVGGHNQESILMKRKPPKL